MEYLDFLEQTRDMKPEQRSHYFNELTPEQQGRLVNQAGDVELLLLQCRILAGAEKVEQEPNVYKRRDLIKHYDKVCEEYRRKVVGA